MAPQENLIDVEVYPVGEESEPIEYIGVNYISLVNGETYGIPALIAEPRIEGKLPATILYVNPENISVMKAVRTQ